MNGKNFRYCTPFISSVNLQNFVGFEKEKQVLQEIVNEWNTKTSMSDLIMNWKKPKEANNNNNSNLLFVVYNVNSLSSHITDLDLLLNNHSPHICILSEIGKASIKKMPSFLNYKLIAQEGTNSFGGVAILIHKSIPFKVVSSEPNFLLIDVETTLDPVLIGAIYVPPSATPPFHNFPKGHKKPFYIFGDFNAKHIDWGCEMNNVNGNRIAAWLEQTGNEMIVPNKATSRRSNAIIDFGITHDTKGWYSEVLDEGSSDHFPILMQSPIGVSQSAYFKLTNWKIFSFFLQLVYEYWLTLVYNYDEQFFFEHFSEFLKGLWDRCSTFKPVK